MSEVIPEGNFGAGAKNGRTGSLSRTMQRATWGRIALGCFGAATIAVGAIGHFGIPLICVTLLGVLLLIGWPQLLQLKHPSRARIVIAIVLLTALAVVNWGNMAQLSLVIALGVVLSYLAHMLLNVKQGHVLEEVSGIFAGCLLVVTAAMWALVWADELGKSVALIFAAVIAVVTIMESIETRISHLLAAINGAVVGIFVAWLVQLPLWAGLAMGLCVALCYAAMSRAVREEERPASPIFAGIARAMVPHCAMGAVAYLFTLILV